MMLCGCNVHVGGRLNFKCPGIRMKFGFSCPWKQEKSKVWLDALV